MMIEKSEPLSALFPSCVGNQLAWVLFLFTWQAESCSPKIRLRRGVKEFYSADAEVRKEMLRDIKTVIVFHTNIQKFPSHVGFTPFASDLYE